MAEDLSDEVAELKEQCARLTDEVRQLQGVDRKVEGLIDMTGGLKEEVIGIRGNSCIRRSWTRLLPGRFGSRAVSRDRGHRTADRGMRKPRPHRASRGFLVFERSSRMIRPLDGLGVCPTQLRWRAGSRR